VLPVVPVVKRPRPLNPPSVPQVADLVEVLHRDMMSNGRHYLVHASHNVFFSHNNVTGCADVGAAAMVIQLDLSRMNQVLRLDIDEGSVTVQSGITFEDLDEFLLGRGLSLQGLGIVSPPFSGMSLGAAIDSAAHGSSLVGPASIAAGLRSAVLVDGLGAEAGCGSCIWGWLGTRGECQRVRIDGVRQGGLQTEREERDRRCQAGGMHCRS